MSKITLLQSYDSPILLENHSEGWVYRISDKYVVKVPSPVELEKYTTHMFYEIKIARLLYSFGISVPEPITCDYVNVRDKVEIGYIMEYIDGITNERSSHSQVLDEVNKANELGFTNTDTGWIFIPKDKEIKLIDFTKWNYKGL